MNLKIIRYFEPVIKIQSESFTNISNKLLAYWIQAIEIKNWKVLLKPKCMLHYYTELLTYKYFLNKVAVDAVDQLNVKL